ncbi:MAG: NADH:ubiquinone reductase (Na(+)-transporting) subunit F [Desulfobacterales bacterium]
MIYLVSIATFAGVTLLLVIMLLFVEARVAQKGESRIIINMDQDSSLTVRTGTNLLSALNANEIYLPSACGGSGSCGQCRCKVAKGGGDILPTELPHLSRSEKKENIRLACQLKIREDLEIEIPPEIFAIEKYRAKVVSNRSIGTFIKELAVELEEGRQPSFEPGQYMQIDIPEYRISFSELDIAEPFKQTWDRFGLWDIEVVNDEPVYRAYSLANPPSEPSPLLFTIRIAPPPADQPGAPPGLGSSYIFRLKQDDNLTLSGPFGEFLVKETDREMCFIGGGAGMAPIRSQIREQLLAKKTERTASFWYGARNGQEMLYDEEFRKLDANFENFSYNVALSEPLPEDNWEGMTGFIHQSLETHFLKTHPDPSEVEYYLCGPPMMLKACIKTLDSYGVEPEMIAYDEF